MTPLMEKADFAKLRKMPPERKVKALRELQDKLTELIKERTKEIEDSQQEIAAAQEFLAEAEEELRVLEEMEETAPKIKRVDVEKLFEREETPAEPAKTLGPMRERELEAIAREAPAGAPSAQDQQAYISFLSRQPIASIYERITKIRDDIKITGIISSYQQEKLDQFRDAIHEKEDAIREGEYAPGRKAEHLLTAAEKAIQYASGREHESHFYRTKHDNQ
jgi:hypothetical protein